MKALILGLGVSGKSSLAYLQSQGYRTAVFDDHKPDQASLENMNEFSMLVVSPGVPPQHKVVLAAIEAGICITNDIELALSGYTGKIIGVTGTNGKSTVCSMCHSMLQELGFRSCLGGNFGVPLTTIVLNEGELPPFIVLELSSYQLFWLNQLKLHTSGFTNFAPDHTQWHGSLRSYFEAKWKMASFTQESMYLDSETLQRANALGLKYEKSVNMDESVLESKSLEGLSEINQNNAKLAACLVSEATGEESALALESLGSFQPLPHRLQHFLTVQGVQIIDDSKATNLHAVESVLTKTSGKRILLMGGSPKGENFQELKKHLSQDITIIAFGEAGHEIHRALDLATEIQTSLAQLCKDLPRFIKRHKPKQVILCPGCASFDEFKNFSERGIFFQKEVSKAFEKTSVL